MAWYWWVLIVCGALSFIGMAISLTTAPLDPFNEFDIMAKAQHPAQPGDNVEILTGDFKGQTGTIVEIDNDNPDGLLQVEIVGVIDPISYHPSDVILLVD